mgnify:FL=1
MIKTEKATANPYWDEIKSFVCKSDYRSSQEVPYDQWEKRAPCYHKYAYAIPDPDSLAFVAEHLGPRAIEIGAGTGYWAWQLSQTGIDILAYDINPPDQIPNGYFMHHDKAKPKTLVKTWYPVQQGDTLALTEYPDRTLFLCWPPYGGSLADECLQAYHGNRFVFIGEGDGGCTGDDAFFERLDKEWEDVAVHDIVQWSCINDCIVVCERKSSP